MSLEKEFKKFVNEAVANGSERSTFSTLLKSRDYSFKPVYEYINNITTHSDPMLANKIISSEHAIWAIVNEAACRMSPHEMWKRIEYETGCNVKWQKIHWRFALIFMIHSGVLTLRTAAKRKNILAAGPNFKSIWSDL